LGVECEGRVKEGRVKEGRVKEAWPSATIHDL
jgi:hypothetical protein